MNTFHLRIEPGAYIPRAGGSIHMQGLAGIYLVKIKHILKREVNLIDGAILMKVQGTKRLIPVIGYSPIHEEAK